MPVRAILFDLFDTLVDLAFESVPWIEVGGRRVPSTYRALHEALAERTGLGFETFVAELGAVDLEVRARLLAEGREYPTLDRFQELLRRLAIDDPELAGTLTRIHMDALRTTARFHPHHVALLRELRGRVRIGICSNFSHAPTARRILEQAELLPHVDAVVVSEEIGLRKPRPEIFEAALVALGCTASETVHVGDDLEADVKGASQLGIVSVWLTRRVRDPERARERLPAVVPTHVIGDLSELPPLIAAL